MRLLLKFALCLMLALGVGFVVVASRSGDVVYSVYEWVSPARFQQYDGLIRTVAAAHELDPMLVKAIVWRESTFDPRKVGSSGERGLMQVSEIAAAEWAKQNHIEDFQVEDLFDPARNLEAGSWYLQRALKHWKNERDPMPYALAEYNAGASRAQRWATDAGAGADGDTFRQTIDFPGTRKYVDSIIARYDFYKRRGRM